MASRLAFIGLGIMGAPMAGHLLSAGHRLVVHTRTRDRANDLLTRGALWADTPEEAARQSDIMFLCLPDTPDVQRVLLETHGVIHGAKPGTIIVDHSTISPSETRDMSRILTEKGIHLLDAPISGGDVGAKNATLSIMVGGPEHAFIKVLPLLNVMGKTITHCGPSGAGQLTKLVNQILVSITNLATCEALTFAKQNGLDLSKTITALANGAAGSWQWSNLGPRMIRDDFAPGFTIDLMQKDLRLVMDAARQSDSPVRATELVQHLFTIAQNSGNGSEGTQSLYKTVQSRKTNPPSNQ